LPTVLIAALTAVLVLATVMPWVPWPHGVVRICDFPRLQIAGLAVGLVPITLLFGPSNFVGGGLVLLQVAVVVVQTIHCVRFTPLHPVQSLDHEGDAGGPNVIRILSTNVKMSNRRFAAVIDLISERQPDIAIVMEIDDSWSEALRPLKKEMPYTVEWPNNNAYGMLLLSKLPLVDPELRFLILDNVPSIRTGVVLKNGDHIRLYAVHPEPPVPHEDTIGRDGELVRVATEVRADPLPAIVTGDLNDVAWSRTTRRFQRLSGLLDPRVGRGFYNTFDARYPLLRWPLDHLFHDPQFQVVSIERLRHIGSDHFPIMFALALHPKPCAGNELSQPDQKDVEEARDLVSDSAELDREPIGSRWER
jgi:endonuclease/exonuclease/phosphatase (EEP) superfamily protein YafD